MCHRKEAAATSSCCAATTMDLVITACQPTNSPTRSKRVDIRSAMTDNRLASLLQVAPNQLTGSLPFEACKLLACIVVEYSVDLLLLPESC